MATQSGSPMLGNVYIGSLDELLSQSPPSSWTEIALKQVAAKAKVAKPKQPPTLTPTAIQSMSGSFEANAQTYGGKATSLRQLRWLGLNVPLAWVIPCSACLTKPQIDLFNIETHSGAIRFAVRSGAPISMPGLLQTKLNVTRSELQKAVEAVWDSWHSEHAKEYREAKGIDHNMGTAVIIQEMVNAQYAGVAFTNSPNNVNFKAEFDPVIEFVKGLGEQLVSGAVQPEPARGDEQWYQDLLSSLKLIHDTFGPSDVEWCYNDYGIYFVQRRDLKFAASPAVEMDANGRKLLFQGRPVGLPVPVTARLITSLTGSRVIKPTDAIYVSEFKPEYYGLMVQAAAILCTTGGKTCHAAIIANDPPGKPAISGITALKAQAASVLDAVVIDGATGKVYEANADDIKAMKKAAKAAKDVVVKAEPLDHNRLPDLRLLSAEVVIPINTLLYRFYWNIMEHAEGRITIERREEVSAEVAKILSSYFYIACLAEARHTRYHNSIEKNPSMRGLLAALLRRGIELPVGKINREEFATNSVPQPNTIQEAIQVMKLISQVFNDLHWTGGSYGGKPWGRIADTVLRYLKSEMSPMMFADFCFNLKHNGGAAFGKFGWMPQRDTQLSLQLDAKQKGLMDVVLQYATYDLFPLIADVKAFAANKYVLPPTLRKPAVEKKEPYEGDPEALLATELATITQLPPLEEEEEEEEENTSYYKGYYGSDEDEESESDNEGSEVKVSDDDTASITESAQEQGDEGNPEAKQRTETAVAAAVASTADAVAATAAATNKPRPSSKSNKPGVSDAK